MIQDPFADLVPAKGRQEATPGFIPGRPKPVAPVEQRRLELSENADVRAARAAERADAAAMRQADAADRQRQLDEKKMNTETQPSESERTAAFLATNLAGGVRDLTGITAANPSAASPELDTALLGGIFGRGTFNSADRQRVEDAQLMVLDSALTLGTGAAYTKEQLEGYRQTFFPQYWDGPDAIADKKRRLSLALEAAKLKAGRSAPLIDEALQAIAGEAQNADGLRGTTLASEAGIPEVMTQGGERQFTTDQDREITANAQRLFDKLRGQPPEVIRQQMDAYADSIGAPHYGPELDDAIRASAGGGIVNFSAPQTGREQISQARGALSGLATEPLGAAVTGAANFVTLGGLDEGAALINGGDAAQYDQAKQAIRQANPTAFMGGELAGAALTGGLGDLLMAGRAVAPAVLSPGALTADAAYASTYGALENNENRVAGAVTGAVTGPLGGTAGRSVSAGASRLLAPTGGSARPLYEAGVRPTLGQRFVNAPGVGPMINTAEEALGSIPILGASVRGARQRARDQFETGGFNDALSDIGDALPGNIRHGTRAHEYTQNAFSRGYEDVRGQLTFARDADFDNGLAALRGEIANGALSDESARRFNRIFNAEVQRRGPQMSGGDFKAMQSQIGKRVRAIRNSQSADQELGDALETVATLVDDAARRNSPPDAVARLDALDRGYAKFVRLEEASKGAGEAGRFTPTQLDNAVKTASGGRAARSKAYQRGDALMQEYSTAGRMLTDRLPNSGTADRVAMGSLLGAGGTFVSPGIPGAAALATLPYAPGVRNLTTGLIAPRADNAIGRLLEAGGAAVQRRVTPTASRVGRTVGAQQSRKKRGK